MRQITLNLRRVGSFFLTVAIKKPKYLNLAHQPVLLTIWKRLALWFSIQFYSKINRGSIRVVYILGNLNLKMKSLAL